MREATYSCLKDHGDDMELLLKKIDYIYYIEHVVREAEMAALVSSCLPQNLQGVYAPLHFDRYRNIAKYNPRAVIAPYCYSAKQDIFKRYKDIYGSDLITINLHQEQITSEAGLQFMMPSDDYSREIDIHIAWGKKFAALLTKHGVDPATIYITGSPRMDLLSEKYGFLNTSKKELSERYKLPFEKKWIFFIDSFSWAFIDDEYLKGVVASGFSEKLAYEQRDFTVKSFQAVKDWLIDVAVKHNKDSIIIYRPHPFLPVEQVRGVFNCPHIYFVREQGINHWLNASDVILSWYSTAVLESYIMKKPTFLVEPFEFPSFMSMEYKNYFPKIEGKDHLNHVVQNEKNVKWTSTIELDRYIEENYFSVDGRSSNRLAFVIQEKLHAAGRNSRINFENYLKNYGRMIIKDFPKNFLNTFGLLSKHRLYKGMLEDNFGTQYIRDLAHKYLGVEQKLGKEFSIRETSDGNIVI